MSNQDFRNLVKVMRETQIKYFATRKISFLERSKQLELAVDNELAGIEPLPEDQLKLF